MATEKQLEVIERKRKEKWAKEHKIIDDIDHKICSEHHTYFPNEEPWLPATEEYFYKNKKNGTDGLYPYCIECTKRKSVKWMKDNPEKFAVIVYKRDYDCSDVRRQWFRDHGRKQRESGYTKEYQQKNPDKMKKYSKDRKHKNHNISKKQWIACKDYFKNDQGKWCCAYCGLPISEHWITYKGVKKLGDFHKEHVDDDGANDLSNCIPSCGSCNSKKWKFDFDKWYNSENPVFSQERLEKINKWLEEDYKLYIKNN